MKYAVIWLAWFTFGLLPVSAAEAKPAEAGYELHEWGVFGVPRNAEWAQLDMKAEWATFPGFFYRAWPEEKLPAHGTITVVFKPVIFLYATQPMAARLSVDFQQGRPLVWWPATSSPVSRNGSHPKNKLSFEVQINANLPTTGFAPVPAGHWVDVLRKVPSHRISVTGDFGVQQLESFIYYDGIIKSPGTPEVLRNENMLSIKTDHPFEVMDGLMVERDDKGVRVSKEWIHIDKGSQRSFITMVPADEAELDKRCGELETRLNAAGLTGPEAKSMVDIWKPGLFKLPGLTFFYRIPQAVYEGSLPLTADPKPSKSVRVGLILHTHLEPELESTVAALIKQLGSDDFEIREAAKTKLIALGGAAFPQLEKATHEKDREIGSACKQILKTLDLRPALDVEKFPTLQEPEARQFVE